MGQNEGRIFYFLNLTGPDHRGIWLWMCTILFSKTREKRPGSNSEIFTAATPTTFLEYMDPVLGRWVLGCQDLDFQVQDQCPGSHRGRATLQSPEGTTVTLQLPPENWDMSGTTAGSHNVGRPPPDCGDDVATSVGLESWTAAPVGMECEASAKDYYPWVLRLQRTCYILDLPGTCHPFLLSFLPFGMKMSVLYPSHYYILEVHKWFHRFTAREEFSLIMNYTLNFTHFCFRCYLDETLNFGL